MPGTAGPAGAIPQAGVSGQLPAPAAGIGGGLPPAGGAGGAPIAGMPPAPWNPPIPPPPPEPIHLIPKPNQMTTCPGTFLLAPVSQVLVGGDFAQSQPVADYLAWEFRRTTGYMLPVAPAPGPQLPPYSVLVTTEGADPTLGPEGYLLDVSEQHVVLRATHPQGLFYAVQSLRQLLPAAIDAAQVSVLPAWPIPCVSVRDKPRFAWRGLMLDVSRHFFPKEEVMRFIDLAARFKYNTLHIHLTDDQGWRIQIDQYPRLTQIGGCREATWNFEHGKRFSPSDLNRTRYCGFFTKSDIREIVSFAQQRYVQLVPEIDMPGHMVALLAAYPERGHNPASPPPVRTFPGVSTTIINLEQQTFTFLENVLRELFELFPGAYVHLGGDEVPKQEWVNSPVAQMRMQQLGIPIVNDPKDAGWHRLQAWFTERMNDFVRASGRIPGEWDEVLDGIENQPGGANFGKRVVFAWRGDSRGSTRKAAQLGIDVVVCPNSTYYFDHYQTPHKPGDPWSIGGLSTLREVYEHDPLPGGLTPAQLPHVLGVQGNLWTEYIPDRRQLDYQAYPRALALAETGWTEQAHRNWQDFLVRLPARKAQLAALQVSYFDEPPGFAWSLPGQTVFRIDVSTAIQHSGPYTATFAYERGAHALEIDWVALEQDGVEVDRDTHYGRTGARTENNVYALRLFNHRPGAAYTIVAQVRGDGGSDSHGSLYIRLAP